MMRGVVAAVQPDAQDWAKAGDRGTDAPFGELGGGAAGEEPLVEVGRQVGHVDRADIVDPNGWLFGSGARTLGIHGALRTFSG